MFVFVRGRFSKSWHTFGGELLDVMANIGVARLREIDVMLKARSTLPIQPTIIAELLHVWGLIVDQSACLYLKVGRLPDKVSFPNAKIRGGRLQCGLELHNFLITKMLTSR